MQNELNQKVKTAVITGASSGIGLACAEKFASEGWNLLIIGRRADRLKMLAIRLKKAYKINVFELELDVRERESGAQLAHFMQRNGIVCDLLINNAGLAVGLEPIQEGFADDWDRMIDTNLKGLLYITRAVSPLMIEQGFGHIINIGSIAGKEAYPKGNVYCATKYAVDGLTKAMRMDLVPYGIRVTQIAPGAVETEFSVVRFKGDEQKAKNVYQDFIPLQSADIADLAWYCANIPAHVNINDIVVMPTAQASASIIHRQPPK